MTVCSQVWILEEQLLSIIGMVPKVGQPVYSKTDPFKFISGHLRIGYVAQHQLIATSVTHRQKKMIRHVYCKLLLLFLPTGASLQHQVHRRDAIHQIQIVTGGFLSADCSCHSQSGAGAFVSANGLILSRFNDAMITQLPPKKGSPTYPIYLEGLWDVQQTLVHCSAPLGTVYMGGPNGDDRIGQASLAEARSKINSPVSLKFRYIRDPSNDSEIIEDRLFNTQQRLDAFAGKAVVSSTVYTRDLLTNKNTAVLIQYRGPAAQKIFTTGFDSEVNVDGSFCCSERQRSLFALTNSNTAPPISTDSELLWKFWHVAEDMVHARLRIAGYLNPNDRLYFDAKRRAVTLQDYSLVLRRIASQ